MPLHTIKVDGSNMIWYAPPRAFGAIYKRISSSMEQATNNSARNMTEDEIKDTVISYVDMYIDNNRASCVHEDREKLSEVISTIGIAGVRAVEKQIIQEFIADPNNTSGTGRITKGKMIFCPNNSGVKTRECPEGCKC